MMKNVLFIHHGTIEGGAPLSLLYTALGLKSDNYSITIALVNPSEELHNLYNEKGLKTVETPWIPLLIKWSGGENPFYNPSVFYNLIVAFIKNISFEKKFINLLDNLKIDIVHLNSSVLSIPAKALIKNKKRFIWHVREQGPVNKGFRFRFISNLMLKAKFIIFLSESEKNSWIGKNKSNGTVIHNFINFEQFDLNKFEVANIKNKYNLSLGEKIILYTGGIKHHKGIFNLLEAISILKSRGIKIKCIMPDSFVDLKREKNFKERIKSIISKIVFKRDILIFHFISIIFKLKIEKECVLLPFNPNIVELFSISDVVVFPATKPHFARPIIEAYAMKKPVVASDFPVLKELVINNETGLLSKVNSQDLANNLENILTNKELASKMGENGFEFAKINFNSIIQNKKIKEIYLKALA